MKPGRLEKGEWTEEVVRSRQALDMYVTRGRSKETAGSLKVGCETEEEARLSTRL